MRVYIKEANGHNNHTLQRESEWEPSSFCLRSLPPSRHLSPVLVLDLPWGLDLHLITQDMVLARTMDLLTTALDLWGLDLHLITQDLPRTMDLLNTALGLWGLDLHLITQDLPRTMDLNTALGLWGLDLHLITLATHQALTTAMDLLTNDCKFTWKQHKTK